MRIAWFSPWPPQVSGVAGRSAEIVPVLAARGLGIDVFVDARHVPIAARAGDDPPAAGAVRVQNAHDFVWRMGRRQYDLAIYQAGNSRQHAFVWPYLFRWPGLAVLHDARLHHARGAALLDRHHTGDYRAEFAWNHPTTRPEAAELAVAGFAGPYYYLWPMTRAVIAASRMVATHARGAIDALAEAAQGLPTPIEYLALGEGLSREPTAAERSAWRDRLGLPADAVVFGVFGALTAEKRIAPILRSFAAVRERIPGARLVLAGAADTRLDVSALVDALGLASSVIQLPPPDDETFDRLIASVDVVLNLRWPTSLETSGPWLRALSAARATVTFALAHQAHVPALNPQDWAPRPGAGRQAPVTVAIEILDEEHSLRRALLRLGLDRPLRDALGAAAREYWTREHTVERMADDYVRIAGRAASAPLPATDLPPACRPDPLAHTSVLLAPFGETACVLR